MKVPQTLPIFDAETRTAVDAVLASGWVTEGKECEAFTAELLDYMKAPYGCLVSNGTVALMLALWAADIGPFDTVGVPTLTFAATGNAVVATGAIPKVYDVDTITGEHDVDIAVSLFGNEPGVVVGRPYAWIEDAAQAIGCWHDGEHAGTSSAFGCFSFYADKTLTTGEGGFVICKDREDWERLEQLRNHGRAHGARGYGHEAFGINARMTDMQAAIGRIQLRHLEEYREARMAHWCHYATELDTIRGLGKLAVDDGCIPFRYVAMVPDPVALATFLEEREIQTRRMFLPLHRQPFLSRYVRPGQTFPNADYAYEHGLLLSVHQNLSESQVAFVCDSIKAFYATR